MDDVEPYDKYEDVYVNPEDVGDDPVAPIKTKMKDLNFSYLSSEESSDDDSFCEISSDDEDCDIEPSLIGKPKYSKILQEEPWDNSVNFFSF